MSIYTTYEILSYLSKGTIEIKFKSYILGIGNLYVYPFTTHKVRAGNWPLS